MNSITTHLLSQSSFWRLSKALVEELGLVKAFILTDLIDKYEYYKEVGKLDEDGYFFYKRENMLKLYPVGETTLRGLLRELSDDKLINMTLKQNGLDRKTFFTIIPENIQILLQNYLIVKSTQND